MKNKPIIQNAAGQYLIDWSFRSQRREATAHFTAIRSMANRFTDEDQAIRVCRDLIRAGVGGPLYVRIEGEDGSRVTEVAS